MGGGLAGDLKSRFNRDNAAVYTRRLFSYVNYTLFTATLASIVTLLLLKLNPTAWGWIILTIDITTFLSAIAGCVSGRKPGLYTCHIVMTAVTAILQGIVALVLFTRPGASLEGLNSDEGLGLIKLKAGLCLFIFCVEWIAVGLSCIIHCCMFHQVYYRGSARVGEDPSFQSHVAVVVKEEESDDKGLIKKEEFENVDL